MFPDAADLPRIAQVSDHHSPLTSATTMIAMMQTMIVTSLRLRASMRSFGL
jgi:hypothetical protein